LESSYFPNYAVPDLEARVKGFIPVELSYVCRFWGAHLKATSFEPSLAEEIEVFFDGERFLFWLEAPTLVKAINSPARPLSSVADWFMVRSCSSFLGRTESHVCLCSQDNGEYMHASDDKGCPALYSNFRDHHFTQHSSCPLCHLLQCSRRYSGNLPQSFLTLIGLSLVMSQGGAPIEMSLIYLMYNFLHPRMIF
jgi:hypothetical protein